MKQLASNNFVGGMNSDDDPRVMPEGDYVTARDILNTPLANAGAITTFQGSSAVVNSMLPTGTKKVVGSREDRQGNSIVYFLYSATGAHKIFRWLYGSNTVQEVASGAVLAFAANRMIHGSFVLDGRILYWVDAIPSATGLSGVEPRHIDMERAVVAGKQLSYELYAGIDGQGQFATGETYSFQVRSLDGLTLIASASFVATGAQEGDRAAGLAWLKSQIEASALNAHVAVDDCGGCKLELSMKAVERRLSLDPHIQDSLLLVSINHYPATLESHHLSLIKSPPDCPPAVKYVGAPGLASNNVARGCFQFRCRYVYRGGELSAWGPISLVALPLDSFGTLLDELNAIEVDFTDTRLSNPSWLAMIEAVEVAVRDGNNSPFKFVERVSVCDIGVSRQVFTFVNDKIYPVVPSDDPSLATDTQVLKLFDSVPVLSAALSEAADKSGNFRLNLANNLEGYDCLDCADVDLEVVDAVDGAGLIEIRGTVRTLNGAGTQVAPGYPGQVLDGMVVYLAGTALHAVSDNPAGIASPTGAFSIKGVPKGRFILRVAAPTLRHDDSLGRHFNLDPLDRELLWQKTSGFVLDCAGSVADTGYPFERIIDLTGFSGDVFDLDTEIGFGTVDLRALVAPTESLIGVYAKDNNGLFGTQALRDAAIGIELRSVHLSVSVGPDLEGDTDHNGFSWMVGTVGTNIIDHNGQIFPTTAAAMFDGFYGTAGTAYPIALTSSSILTLSLYNAGNLRINHGGTISGVITGGDGRPVANCLVCYARNGRQTYTNTDGEYSIEVFDEFDAQRNTDLLWVTNMGDVSYLYPPSPLTNTPDIDPLNNLDAEVDFSFALLRGLSSYIRSLKQGGSYGVGIVYEDGNNRTCGTVPISPMPIPGVAELGRQAALNVKWSINHVPPIEAHHYRFVRTRNTVHDKFVQYAPSEVRYVKIMDPKVAPVNTTFAAGDATHILLRVNANTGTTSGDLVSLFNQPGNTGYFPEAGDRVRFLLSATKAAVGTQTIEADVVGLHLDGADFYAVISVVDFLPEVVAGWLVEFYTPRRSADGFDYESDACYPIIDAGTVDRRHGGQLQDQVIGSLPAVGVMQGGDTYWRPSSFDKLPSGSYQFNTEHDTISDYHLEACEDIGRAFLYDPNARQQHNFDGIRFSGIYIPATSINGLSSFGGLDYGRINRSYGQIRWLGQVRSVLLAICQFKSQPIYVGSGELLTLSGESSIGRSDRVLNIAEETVGEFGTHNPESVVVQDGQVFVWDNFRGVVWRFGADGTTPINNKMWRYFRARGFERWRMSRNDDFVAGGFDRRTFTYFLSFSPGTYINLENQTASVTSETIAFDVTRARWSQRYSFVTECFGRVSTELVAFNAGDLWRLFTSFVYNNVFGVQYQAQVQFVVNPAPATVKDWWNVRVRSNKRWQMPVIRTSDGFDYAAGGMLSRLKGVKFSSYENQWCADFLRDMSDTSKQFRDIADIPTRQATALLRGRMLKGEVLVITMETDANANSFITLNGVDTEFSQSFDSQ